MGSEADKVQEHGKQGTGKRGSDAVGTVMMLARLMLKGGAGATQLEHHQASSRKRSWSWFLPV